MSVFRRTLSAWEREGARYVLRLAPRYLKSRLDDFPTILRYYFYNPYGHVNREGLLSGCRDSGRLWRYGSAGEFTIPDPVCGDTPAAYEREIGTHSTDPAFVCELPDVRLVGDRAMVRTSRGKLLLEEMGTKFMLRSRFLETIDEMTLGDKFREMAAPIFGGDEERALDSVVNLIPRHGEAFNNYANYGHWLMEDLPRLQGFHHYVEQTGCRPLLLLKNDPPSWMIETLRLLGFSSSDWIEWDVHSATVSNLVVPQLRYVHSWGWSYNPAGRQWVSDRVKSNVEALNEQRFSSRIYVSRQAQPRRKISNYDAVKTVLDEFGFDVISPEELSLPEQVNAFHHADVITGPNGSGFANALFAEDATLVQILPYGLDPPPWYVLAGEMGLDYGHFYGVQTAESTASKNDDIHVDTAELRTLLREIS